MSSGYSSEFEQQQKSSSSHTKYAGGPIINSFPSNDESSSKRSLQITNSQTLSRNLRSKIKPIDPLSPDKAEQKSKSKIIERIQTEQREQTQVRNVLRDRSRKMLKKIAIHNEKVLALKVSVPKIKVNINTEETPSEIIVYQKQEKVKDETNKQQKLQTEDSKPEKGFLPNIDPHKHSQSTEYLLSHRQYGYRNDFVKIKEHQKEYMQRIKQIRPSKQQSSSLENRKSFILEPIRDQAQLSKQKEKLMRRKEYSQKILRKKVNLSPPQKLDFMQIQIKNDQERNPAKYFILQNAKGIPIKEIYEQKNPEYYEGEVIKQLGNQYLKDLRQRLKKYARKQKKTKQQTGSSFGISKRYKNYLPSLNLSNSSKSSSRAKISPQKLRTEAEDLEGMMLRKINQYVQMRRQGRVGYVEKAPIETDIDITMIQAVRAKLAFAERV